MPERDEMLVSNENGENVVFSVEREVANIKATYGELVENIAPLQAHVGVSGTQLFEAKVLGCPAIIKIGPQIGALEEEGAKILAPYLPVLESLGNGEHFIIYPKIEVPDGDSLHNILIKPIPEREKLIEGFASMHKKMWAETEKRFSGQVPIAGYIFKLDRTREMVNRLPMMEVGLNETFGELVEKYPTFVINGITVGCPSKIFQNMQVRIIEGYKNVSLTHGDESMGNCMVANAGDESKLVMIDNNDFGYRSVYESIAKMLGWYIASQTKAHSSRHYIKDERLYINTQTTMSLEIFKAVDLIRKQFGDYLATNEQKSILAANLMMYFLREPQWVEKRNRKEMIPYLISTALSFAPALENGRYAPFPIQEREKGYRSLYRVGEAVQKDVKPKELKNPHRILRLEKESDLNTVVDEIEPLLHKLEFAAFDLDNTLCGQGIEFPNEGLLKLRGGLEMAVSSGAGIRSIEQRLRTASGVPKRAINHFFDAVISEDGARIIQPGVDVDNLSAMDILAETMLTEEELEETTIFFNEIQKDAVEYFGFYPPSDASPDFDPFSYISYVPENNRRPEILKGLIERFGSNIHILPEAELFTKLLNDFGATKFVIKPRSRNVTATLLEIAREELKLNANKNEGYINITSKETDKYRAIKNYSNMLMETGELTSSEITHFGNDLNDFAPLRRVQIGFIVDSDRQNTDLLIRLIKGQKRTGYTVVVKPELINSLLLKISSVKNGKR